MNCIKSFKREKIDEERRLRERERQFRLNNKHLGLTFQVCDYVF